MLAIHPISQGSFAQGSFHDSVQQGLRALSLILYLWVHGSLLKHSQE
jgi:hypothetical protein